MGKTENLSRQRHRKEKIQQYVLAAIGVAGSLALAAAAPNVAGMFARTISNLPQMRSRTRSAANKLAQKGLIRFVERDRRTVLEITPEGSRVLALELAKKSLAKKRKWDGRYRIVAFDIPQRLKKRRDTLRRTVRSLGFLHLQHSMWVFPYDCEELVMLLKSELKLGKYIVYMIADEIENDGWIRRHFKLPLRT